MTGEENVGAEWGVGVSVVGHSNVPDVCGWPATRARIAEL